ncbi:MAG: winged helix-turn-helix transcriptional regulator [Ruminococcus sp.]|nr:winged helix-turn-helix transcriptional regulator [Ruminococcus sp.]
MIRDNDKISRQELAEAVGLSIRSVTRKLSEIPNIQYVGKGKNGH